MNDWKGHGNSLKKLAWEHCFDSPVLALTMEQKANPAVLSSYCLVVIVCLVVVWEMVSNSLALIGSVYFLSVSDISTKP